MIILVAVCNNKVHRVLCLHSALSAVSYLLLLRLLQSLVRSITIDISTNNRNVIVDLMSICGLITANLHTA